MTKKFKYVLARVENIVGEKGIILVTSIFSSPPPHNVFYWLPSFSLFPLQCFYFSSGYQHFLFPPQCFYFSTGYQHFLFFPQQCFPLVSSIFLFLPPQCFLLVTSIFFFFFPHNVFFWLPAFSLSPTMFSTGYQHFLHFPQSF